MTARAETLAPGIELWCGDCRDILPTLSGFDAVVTDPPWDQARGIPSADDPRGLFAAAAPHIARAKRAVVQLGHTDPMFLAPLAQRMPFVTALWLEYSCPSYLGRVLRQADLAYAFGAPVRSGPSRRVVPAKIISTGYEPGEIGARNYGRNRGSGDVADYLSRAEHPMPRHLRHVRWLVRWWSDEGECVLDPFMGSGTAGVAAVEAGRRFIGIEVDASYYRVARDRITAALAQLRLPLAVVVEDRAP